MANFRLFVEKYPHFNIEAQQLLSSLNKNLQLNLSSLRIINVYDIFNLEAEELAKAKYIVFGERTVDTVTDNLNLPPNRYLAVQMLPGQYNQRADSAIQALNLLNINNPNLALTTAKIIFFERDLSTNELKRIRNFYLNPLEMQEKDLSSLQAPQITSNQQTITIYHGFNTYAVAQLSQFKQQYALAMSVDDLQCIQDYFKQQAQREPNETEIKVLDTYWSDHCRHTTFETELTKIDFAPGEYRNLFANVFAKYLSAREMVHTKTKPITLMDLATIYAKELRHKGGLTNLDLSNEINACSLIIKIEVNQQPELWSLQFKNETHNHPTEIEPFGGAATCIGGAIRDPLSGRTYVYQALRISGATNPLEPIEKTLKGKLPQQIISSKAAHGFSSYGNQIGLATTFVKEIYHPGYKAKRMEVGMVVAAAPYTNIHREEPSHGDVVILLGGRTGRDGCGGATGSSKAHNLDSTNLCAAEVQNGNPIIERKIQRLFRNPQLTQLIKKCNDFGAGGVAVAIGELAAGISIDLDKIPTKYHGLTATELAISESQERMAVVINRNDIDEFINLATQENLEASVVATITADRHLRMSWRGNCVLDLARDFLDTNGARAKAKVIVNNPHANQYPLRKFKSSAFNTQLSELVQELNICSQQGLSDMFDATIGASSVLMPYGGKYQLTPVQASVQQLPVLHGTTNTVSLASFGFDPYLSSWSPFHGAYYALIHAVAKIIATGGTHTHIHFSFQEYFERLNDDAHKWGKVFAALLGAYHAQSELGLAAIGGKDSMSGSFNELHVPPTLIAFALTTAENWQIISPELKNSQSYIYLYLPAQTSQHLLNITNLKQNYTKISQLIQRGIINAAIAVDSGGIAEALFLMSIGNKFGVDILTNNATYDLFNPSYGALVFASATELDDEEFQLIALSKQNSQINYQQHDIELDYLIKLWQEKLDPLFPMRVNATRSYQPLSQSNNINLGTHTTTIIAKPRVLIPIFPGTNCEYDSIKAFDHAGALSTSCVFNNLSIQHINQSIQQLANMLDNTQILMLAGGFSAGDEPDGSAKFIATVLRNAEISAAIERLLARDGLILGICNGFQALIKSGLLPYGQICDLSTSSPTLTHNLIGRHISRLVPTKISSTKSPWLSSFNLNEVHYIPMSHGEGRLVLNEDMAQELAKNGQIACQYVDLNGNPTYDAYFNPNGSDYAIEALSSADGRILGKMGHSERYGQYLYKNIQGNKSQDIFQNGVNYFK